MVFGIAFWDAQTRLSRTSKMKFNIIFHFIDYPFPMRERYSYHRKCCSIIGISGWDKSLVFVVSERTNRNLQGKLNNTHHEFCLQCFSFYIYNLNKIKRFKTTCCQILEYKVIL
jgi:hypothetical protein